MKKEIITVILLFIVVSSCNPDVIRQQTAETSPPEPEPEITKIVDKNTNIHYTGKYCRECHERTPTEGGDLYLKFDGDYQILCRCHHGLSPGFCHPLEVDFKKINKSVVPESLPLAHGRITCNTCHDVYKQCQKRLFDRQSLRGTPYPFKTDLCYRCHDPDAYEALNAHGQVAADGRLKSDLCLYCHEKKPDETVQTYAEVTFVGDIKALCRRCHQIRGNHAGNFDHMAKKPSTEGFRRMEALKEKYNIILPLTKDGKMTCITCHNPHEKGVIPEEKPSAKGADSRYRWRLPKIMCKECHQM